MFRSSFIHETCAQVAFTMGQHGMAIDPRHTMLLADCMTYKARPATPAGIRGRRGRSAPLCLAHMRPAFV